MALGSSGVASLFRPDTDFRAAISPCRTASTVTPVAEAGTVYVTGTPRAVAMVIVRLS